jgi:hypothetical protein
MRISRLLFAILFLALAAGCTATLEIPSGYVRANSAQFNVPSLQKKTAYLVISPELERYQFEKEAYNWAGGSTFPDKLTFELGRAVSDELNSAAISLFGKTARYSSLKEATASSSKSDYVVVPAMESASLDLPAVRFTNITARVSLKYSVYDSSGTLLRTGTASGEGKKALEFTKQNYVIAFQEAIKDLMLKSKETLARLLAGP